MTLAELITRIDAFERSAMNDPEVEKQRTLVAQLTTQADNAQRAVLAANDRYAHVSLEAEAAVTAGKAFPDKALAAALAEVQATKAKHQVMAGAFNSAEAKLKALEGEIERSFAGRYEPELAHAVRFVEARARELNDAEAQLERLQKIAARRLHPVRWSGLLSGFACSLPGMFQRWRERMVERGLLTAAR